MAYADQSMSTRKAVSIGIVALLHVALGYAFITGLAFNVVKKVAKDLNVIDVKEPPPPPEKPPPPPPPEQKVQPPPIVAPPPIVRTNAPPPPMVIAPAPPVPSPAPPVVITPTAPPAPVISKAAGVRGDASAWFSDADYPPGAQRDQKEGSVRIAYTVNTAGRVENCRVTQSSGTPELDDVTCRLMVRRGKFTPAQDTAGAPIASNGTRTVTWRLPKD